MEGIWATHIMKEVWNLDFFFFSSLLFSCSAAADFLSLGLLPHRKGSFSTCSCFSLVSNVPSELFLFFFFSFF